MASLPGQDFSSWTSAPGGSGGLGSLAAAYLAHKAGLIDLNDPSQMDNMQKNGIGSAIASKMLSNAVKPPQTINQPIVPQQAVAPQSAAQPSMDGQQTSFNDQSIDDTLPAFLDMSGLGGAAEVLA